MKRDTDYLLIGKNVSKYFGGYVLDEAVYGETIECIYKKKHKCERLESGQIGEYIHLSEKEHPFMALAALAARHSGDAKGVIFEYTKDMPKKCLSYMAATYKAERENPNIDVIFLEKGFFGWKEVGYNKKAAVEFAQTIMRRPLTGIW